MARLEWNGSAASKTRPEKSRVNSVAVVSPTAANGRDRKEPRASARHLALDGVTDPCHWTYKIPGAIVVFALALATWGLFASPKATFVSVQLLALYLLVRFLIVLVFYPVGVHRMAQKEREAEALAGLQTPVLPDLGVPVHHIVLVPNYKEPIEILQRSLDRLAEQENARRDLTVVLAMEEAEPGALAKGRRLAAQYREQFAHFLVSVHPRNLPGEAVGKGSNEAWAARQAKRELVDRLGKPLDAITITSCDADSLLHPHYFSELGRQFVSAPGRYTRFWQAPFRYSNNVWDVPAPVRLIAFLNNVVQVSELANPSAINLPLSTYSLSLRLADDVGYWDEAVIAEDWHMFLRALFGSSGRARLHPIFLPTTGDAVGGPTFLEGLRLAYRQRVRHAWGSADIGYIVQQWSRHPETPLFTRLLYLGKVLHDHVLFTLAGVLLAAGSLTILAQQGLGSVAQPIPGVYTILFQVGNVMSAGGMWLAWLHEHTLSRSISPGWRPASFLADLATWPLIALATLGLVVAPTLEAQGRQLLGGRLTYSLTPKRVRRAAEALIPPKE